MTSTGRIAFRSRIAALCGTALAALSLAGQAAAQSGSEPSEAGASSSDIVVTAQRRSERLIEVPAALSALSNDALINSGISDTKQLSQAVPGLVMSQGSLNSQPTIRGIGGRGNLAGDEALVPLYIDGIYQPFVNGANFEFNNIERVEVLRGPQGTLYGRNAMGGAINIVTRAPTQDFGLTAAMAYSSFGTMQGSAYLTGGLTTGLAADVAINHVSSEGFGIDDLSGRQLSNHRSFNLRTSVLASPADNIDWRLSYAYSNYNDPRGLAVQPVNRNTAGRRPPNTGVYLATEPYHSALSFYPYARYRIHQGSSSLTLNMGGFDVLSLTGYQEVTQNYITDSDGSVTNSAFFDVNLETRSFNQEFVISSTGRGFFEWQAGYMYFNDVGRFKPVLTVPVIINSRTSTKSHAGYAQGTFNFTDQISFTAGGRYTTEKRTYSINQQSRSTGVVTSRIAPDVSSNKFTPSATLSFKPDADTHAYLKYSQAFKSGVFSPTSLNTVPTRPETITAYEGGLKMRLDPRFGFEVAGYYYNYDDLQVTVRDPLTGAAGVQNAAKARVYGAEVSANANLFPRFNVNANIALNHSRYTSFPNAQVTSPRADGGNNTITFDASDRPLVKAPGVTWNIAADYSWDMIGGEMKLAGSVYHSGKSYWDPTPRLPEAPFTLVNAQLGWTSGDERLTVAVFGRNLLDEIHTYSLTTSANGDIRSLAEPRSFGVRVGFDFD